MQEVCSISVKQIEPILSSIVLLRDLVCTKTFMFAQNSTLLYLCNIFEMCC